MRNKAIHLVTLLCVPVAAALIASPLAAVSENFHAVAACTGSEFPENSVRTAASAGEERSACTPAISDTTGVLQDGSTSVTS
jgi:hypothetical protein